jgi:hypothetical protein
VRMSSQLPVVKLAGDYSSDLLVIALIYEDVGFG